MAARCSYTDQTTEGYGKYDSTDDSSYNNENCRDSSNHNANCYTPRGVFGLLHGFLQVAFPRGFLCLHNRESFGHVDQLSTNFSLHSSKHTRQDSDISLEILHMQYALFNLLGQIYLWLLSWHDSKVYIIEFSLLLPKHNELSI